MIITRFCTEGRDYTVQKRTILTSGMFGEWGSFLSLPCGFRSAHDE